MVVLPRGRRRRRPVVNYSGGTEVSGGIVGCNLVTPIRAGLVQRALPPGTAADVAGPNGASLRGEVGELVIRAPLSRA